MHATSMSRLMDNFLAPRYISGKHLTFIDTNLFDIPSTGGLHQFNTWSDFSKACTEQSSKCRLFTWPGLAWGQMNGGLFREMSGILNRRRRRVFTPAIRHISDFEPQDYLDQWIFLLSGNLIGSSSKDRYFFICKRTWCLLCSTE